MKLAGMALIWIGLVLLANYFGVRGQTGVQVVFAILSAFWLLGTRVWLRHVRAKRAEDNRTKCFCPGCAIDLCSRAGALVEDAEFVKYACPECGSKSVWDFGAPAPILLEKHITN